MDFNSSPSIPWLAIVISVALFGLSLAHDEQRDIYILVDSQDTIQPKHEALVSNTLRAIVGSSDNTWFGVGYYSASGEDDGGFVNAQPIQSGRLPVIEAVVRVPFSSTERKSGSNLLALYGIATSNNNEIGWRKDSTKIILYFGQQSGEEPICQNNLKLNRKFVIFSLFNADIRVMPIDMGCINCPPDYYGCGGDFTLSGGPQQAIDIAAGTKGLIVGNVDQLDILEGIQYMLDNNP